MIQGDQQRVRYLLMQLRNPADAMREQEIRCFAWALRCDPSQIQAHDLLQGAPAEAVLGRHDIVLVGGSGEYSASQESPWLNRALDCLRDLHTRRLPLFGSCWGFQAIAKALGGTVVHDRGNAELGSLDVMLTPAGENDPVFGKMPQRFKALMGHEDHVIELPPSAELLASSARVPHQAFRLTDAPWYATQFHPELQRETYLDRIRAYPQYVTGILGISAEQFEAQCEEVPDSRQIITNFVHEVLQ